MTSTKSAPTVDVVPIIENQKAGRFWLSLFGLSLAITFVDGFDFQIISFAGRYIKESFALSSTQLGTLGSMGAFGTLLGGLGLGYLGDRIGRRPATIIATGGFGVTVLMFALAQDYTQLLVLRFVSAIFLGGVLPLTWALCSEFAPARFRATSVAVIMVGYSVGAAVGGPVSNLLIPTFGWQAVFIVGGVSSLIILIPVAALLPESVKFLAQKGIRPDRTARILQRVQPGIALPSGATFVVGTGGVDKKRFTPAELFRGSLFAITSLTWLAYICSSAVVYFLVFWGPIVNERIGFSVGAAATIASVSILAGCVGQLVIGRFIDNRGAGTIAVLPLLAVPCLLIIGLVQLPPVLYLVVLFAAFFCVLGGHGGMHSIAGIFYRPAIRASGAAWATSIAKFGAMLGPWLAGVIMDLGAGVQGTFFVFASFPLLMAALLFWLGRLQRTLPADAEGALLVAQPPPRAAAPGTVSPQPVTD